MARKADPNSVRQRAFAMLDDLTETKREHAIKQLKDTFDIGDSYAATIYASHRTINKDSGTMPQVFTVRDTKDGKPVVPYLKVENTFNPSPMASKTVAKAKAQYVRTQKAKIVAVKKLCLN